MLVAGVSLEPRRAVSHPVLDEFPSVLGIERLVSAGRHSKPGQDRADEGERGDDWPLSGRRNARLSLCDPDPRIGFVSWRASAGSPGRPSHGRTCGLNRTAGSPSATLVEGPDLDGRGTDLASVSRRLVQLRAVVAGAPVKLSRQTADAQESRRRLPVGAAAHRGSRAYLISYDATKRARRRGTAGHRGRKSHRSAA